MQTPPLQVSPGREATTPHTSLFVQSRKMMTTIHKFGNRYRVITKGAPDILIKRCSKFYANNNVASLNMNTIKNIEQQNEIMANNALRVIAVRL